jgi:hypothetical protein
VSAASAAEVIGPVDQLLAEAEALTNPPDVAALGTLLGRVVNERLEPLPERQVLARIKGATGIAVAILEKRLVELRRRLNTTGSVHGQVLRPRWAGRLRLNFSGTPERNEANVIIALTRTMLSPAPSSSTSSARRSWSRASCHGPNRPRSSRAPGGTLTMSAPPIGYSAARSTSPRNASAAPSSPSPARSWFIPFVTT